MLDSLLLKLYLYSTRSNFVSINHVRIWNKESSIRHFELFIKSRAWPGPGLLKLGSFTPLFSSSLCTSEHLSCLGLWWIWSRHFASHYDQTIMVVLKANVWFLSELCHIKLDLCIVTVKITQNTGPTWWNDLHRRPMRADIVPPSLQFQL